MNFCGQELLDLRRKLEEDSKRFSADISVWQCHTMSQCHNITHSHTVTFFCNSFQVGRDLRCHRGDGAAAERGGVEEVESSKPKVSFSFFFLG